MQIDLGKPAVVERRRHRLLHVDDVVVAARVQLIGRDAGHDIRPDHVQDFGREPAGSAHLLLLGRRLDRHLAASHGARRGAVGLQGGPAGQGLQQAAHQQAPGRRHEAGKNFWTIMEFMV